MKLWSVFDAIQIPVYSIYDKVDTRPVFTFPVLPCGLDENGYLFTCLDPDDPEAVWDVVYGVHAASLKPAAEWPKLYHLDIHRPRLGVTRFKSDPAKCGGVEGENRVYSRLLICDQSAGRYLGALTQRGAASIYAKRSCSYSFI